MGVTTRVGLFAISFAKKQKDAASIPNAKPKTKRHAELVSASHKN